MAGNGPSFHFIYVFKGQCTLINISVNVPVLASRLIFNCSPLARCYTRHMVAKKKEHIKSHSN